MRCSVFYWGPKFALVAKPLYDIMGPSATFRWGTEQEKAFDELREKLMYAPVHAYPNLSIYLGYRRL